MNADPYPAEMMTSFMEQAALVQRKKIHQERQQCSTVLL